MHPHAKVAGNPQTGVWIAEVPTVRGAYAQGLTREHALANLDEVLVLLREGGELSA